MPHELNSTMICTHTGRPSIDIFSTTVISSTSRTMLEDLAAAHPECMTEDKLAASLPPKKALAILEAWQAEIKAGTYHAPGAPICACIAEMAAKARSGHTWIITSE